MKLVLATHNKGKIREFQKVFSEIGWEAVPVADVSDAPDPEETGKTFKENALQKAHYYAKVTNLPVLSDDSGIIADVLGDRPGVYSARYAGKHGDDEANNRKLVEDLKPYTGDDRKGHYVCVIALVWPDGKEITAEGTCEGIIRDFYKGNGGVWIGSAVLPAAVWQDDGRNLHGGEKQDQPSRKSHPGAAQ